MALAVLLIWAIHKVSDIPVMEALDASLPAVIVVGVFVVTFASDSSSDSLFMARIRDSSSARFAFRTWHLSVPWCGRSGIAPPPKNRLAGPVWRFS